MPNISLPPKDWIIQQTWEDVLFIHFRVKASKLQNLIPKELEVDLSHNEAFVSIVPFQMSQVRFPWTPVLPFSKLWELNLRTYVKYRGEAGVYFFTLDSNHKLANWIAKKFFHLPYRNAKLTGNITDDAYVFNSDQSLNLKAKTNSEQMDKQNTTDYALHRWLTERYRLFAETPKGIAAGEVLHEPWPLQEASILEFQNDFSSQFDLPLEIAHKTQYFGSAYAKKLRVRFRPFHFHCAR